MKLASGLMIFGAFSLLAGCADPKKEPASEAAPPSAASTAVDHYSMDDFARVRKFDTHVHINVQQPTLLEQARADNFELMTINVDYPDFVSLPEQRAAALSQLKADPKRVYWTTTFSMKGFGKPAWLDAVKASLAADAKQGARAVKVWKN